MTRSTLLLTLASLLAGSAAGQETHAHARPDGTRQHLVVVTEAPDASVGELFRMERAPEGWRRVGEPVPVVLGRSGVGEKREGDGRSPRGVFRLGPAFGYAPQAPPDLKISYRPMAPGAVCVDDADSGHYNRIVDPGELPGGTDWGSAEAMRRDLVYGDALYRWGVEVFYNRSQEPGAGSCIFLHVWRGPESPTAGCTAMPERDLLRVMTWLQPERHPVLVQGTRTFLETLRDEGSLPYPVPGGS